MLPEVEKQLLAKIVTKDEHAFREFVDYYQVFVIRLCLRFTNNRDDAKDIAQEVFIEVFRSADKFRQESKISTWLYRIAVNKSLNFIRANKKNRMIAYLDDLFGEESDSYDKADFAEHFRDGLEISEEQQILNSAIASLPESQKLAFTLHKIEGLPYKEISDIMDASLSSVESLIHRAKSGLQKRLYKYYKKNYT
jgi:RNA polymerase sigma-70 factor, ECF subfamily